ncbi:MAG TPA: hypothetical protein VE338_21705 [Ktedonobacterales bacterium]|nr:hypothetical protein [Ktedonobacterales bacterium]
MPAKSFIGDVEDAARRFYATAMRGEVSDANVRGYLRAASQITDIWGQIDDQIAEDIAQGVTPWDAYTRRGYALAFIRAARAYQVFVQELLAADAAADPATLGYLPRVTYDQANALAHHILPNLQRAVAALTDSAYQPDTPLPITLGPRIESEAACPATHLEGVIAAAREVREWAAGLIAQYADAVQKASSDVQQPPTTVTEHIARLNSQLAQADTQLRFGEDLVGEVTQGQATAELHEQAEDSLWGALRTYFRLNQAVALPDLLRPAERRADKPNGRQRKNGATSQRHYQDQPIRPDDLWRIAAPSARSELRGTDFGRDEMREMCEKMGGVLSAGAQQYLDEMKEAERRGDILIVGAMANCPFEALYRARRPLEVAGTHVAAGHEFHWNFHRGHMESAKRFDRTEDWQECEE